MTGLSQSPLRKKGETDPTGVVNVFLDCGDSSHLNRLTASTEFREYKLLSGKHLRLRAQRRMAPSLPIEHKTSEIRPDFLTDLGRFRLW